MDESAVYTYDLKNHKLRPTGHFNIGCSLYKALNKPTTTIEHVMKWNWQIAESTNMSIETGYQYLYPIDTQLTRVDANGNIVYGTVFRPRLGVCKDSDILTANSIIGCHSTMIQSIDIENMSKERKRKFQIFDILVQYNLMNSKLNRSNNMPLAAFFAIDRLCELIESGIVDKLELLYID